MNWIALNTDNQIELIREASFVKPQLIFKHSTTCSISKMAYSRFERAEAPDTIDFYYLDLLNYRQISTAIAEAFQVHHESPQILLIKNGECIYDESHYGIMMDDVIEQAGV
ncbi:MAG: bacillithiol system redox-active protein YtxJ [Bacteroidota bacterium]|jgi:bacillithiol system protein YtxJ